MRCWKIESRSSNSKNSCCKMARVSWYPRRLEIRERECVREREREGQRVREENRGRSYFEGSV
jgi:hypothetical protein